MKTETIKISDITLDAGTQTRVELNEDRVSMFHEIIEEIGDMDPVEITFDGLKYYLTDGFHRVMAHTRATRDYIEANVTPGTLEDAIRRSLSANAKHGLPRSNADRRKSVNIALDHEKWGKLSARDIAKMCVVSHTFVSNVISERSGKPKKDKPVKLKNVVEAPLEERPTKEEPPLKVATLPEDDMVQEVLAENEQLKDRLAVAAMDATDEEKELAQETIEELRTTVKNLNLELDAVKRSRDQFQRECAELKKQVKMYQNQLKKAA
jgi:uncharacterized ParB-like nuclease family protein/FtsZ-binding cell division protein ZapB